MSIPFSRRLHVGTAGQFPPDGADPTESEGRGSLRCAAEVRLGPGPWYL